MAEPVTLDQIFGAFVNQDTLEDAASLMADLVDSYPELHEEFTSVLSQAIDARSANEKSVISAVQKSGYYVNSLSEAKKYCSELLSLYRGLRVRP